MLPSSSLSRFVVMMMLLLISIFFALPAPVLYISAQDFDEFAQSFSSKYTIERRISDGESWRSIASFELFQSTPGAPARLKNVVSPRQTVSDAEREMLGISADLVYYRLVPSGSTAKMEKSLPTIAVSPCTIIRGFNVLGKTTMVLTEKLNVIIGSGAEAIGLQVWSMTNNFHSSMNGDECDRSMVAKIFPKVEIELKVDLVPSLPVAGVKYKELEKLVAESERQVKPERAKTRSSNAASSRRRRVEDDQNEEEDDTEDYHDVDDDAPRRRRGKRKDGDKEDYVDEDETKPEPTFFQKYWMWMVLPFIFSMIRGGASGAQQARAPQQA